MTLNPVVFAEVQGENGATLRQFYTDLFGWAFEEMQGPMDYGMAPPGEGGIGVGVGAAPEGQKSMVTFYVRTKDVAAALDAAERLGGTVAMPVTEMPDGTVIALFDDPEGHTIGLVTPADG
jgi:predicted enzyme related to lactoylglutathione lyase